MGFVKRGPSAQKNTQLPKPALGNATKDIIDEGTPMKKGAAVVTKHLNSLKGNLTVDSPVKPVATLDIKKERRSFPVQRLPLTSRTLHHGRTWLKVGPGEFTNNVNGLV